MKVTKKHIAYLTVLAIGGGWLSMDYLTGSTPGVSAASAALVASDAAPGNTAPTALAADMGDEPAIARRLDKLSAIRNLHDKAAADGFALPAAFTAPPPPTPATATPAATAATTFASHHILTSVMVGDRSSSALVDGQSLLKIGDRIDGFVLTGVTKTSAVFTSNAGARAVLKFSIPSTSLTTASIQGQ